MSVKILVVDDSEVPRIQVASYLAGDDYEIDLADGPKSAIELIKKNNYPIIITDKNMPDINNEGVEGGMYLLKYIQQNLPQTEVIMMTGNANIQTAIKAMQLGAFDYLVKPFSKNELLDTINRILEYQQFINPENTIKIYKGIHNEILDLFSNRKALNDEERHKKLKSIDAKIDYFFITQKSWEKIILTQRDALANISGYITELIQNISQTDPSFELVEKIIEESKRHI